MQQKERPLVSVVVPIYNVEDYLRQCIDSILSQSYSELQVILVDDGSPDGCGEIIDAYAEKDRRIECIHKKNGGLSSARNAGKTAARGDYIVFIDSDDYIHKQFIEVLLDDIAGNDADISTCYFDSFIKDCNDADIMISDKPQSFTREEAIREMYRNDSFGWNAWNKMYRMSLFDDIDYPEGVICEDKATIYKLIMRSEKVVYRKLPLYHYRIRENSISNERSVRYYSDSLMINEIMERDLDASDIPGAGNMAKAYTAKCGFLTYAAICDLDGYEEIAQKAYDDLKNKYTYLKYADYISMVQRTVMKCCGISAAKGKGVFLRMMCHITRIISKLRRVGLT